MPDTEILGQQFRDQFRNILDAVAADADRFDNDIAAARQQGWRIIVGGPVPGGYEGDDDGSCDYECRDWGTGEPLFTGRGPAREFHRTVDKKSEEEGRPWIFLDDVHVNVTGGEEDEVPARAVPVPGIPRSLVAPLAEWAKGHATSRELAGLTGFAVDEVKHMMRALDRIEP